MGLVPIILPRRGQPPTNCRNLVTGNMTSGHQRYMNEAILTTQKDSAAEDAQVNKKVYTH